MHGSLTGVGSGPQNLTLCSAEEEEYFTDRLYCRRTHTACTDSKGVAALGPTSQGAVQKKRLASQALELTPSICLEFFAITVSKYTNHCSIIFLSPFSHRARKREYVYWLLSRIRWSGRAARWHRNRMLQGLWLVSVSRCHDSERSLYCKLLYELLVHHASTSWWESIESSLLFTYY